MPGCECERERGRQKRTKCARCERQRLEAGAVSC